MSRQPHRTPRAAPPPPVSVDDELWSTHGLTVDAALGPLDRVATETERRWGHSRLMRLVSPETALKWSRANNKLSLAIQSRDSALVAQRASVLMRGWAAVESEALESGHKPLPEGAWGVTHGGVGYVIARHREDAPALSQGLESPEHVVTIDELLLVWADHKAATAAREVKMLWPGAEVVRFGDRSVAAKPPARGGRLTDLLNDKLPF